MTITIDQRAMRWAVALLGCEPGECVRDLAAYKFLRLALQELEHDLAPPAKAGCAWPDCVCERECPREGVG